MRISDWSSDVCSSDLLCKRTSRALDGDDCPYWFEATQEQPMDLAGYYRYEARWPNGSKTVGTADVDKLHAGDDEGYAELIIRDPESNRSEERRVGKECVSTCR